MYSPKSVFQPHLLEDLHDLTNIIQVMALDGPDSARQRALVYVASLMLMRLEAALDRLNAPPFPPAANADQRAAG